MPPNQVPPIYPSGGQNPYDFILNGQQKSKRSIIPTPGGSQKDRLLFYIAGGGVLLALILIFIMVFFSGGGSTEQLTKIAQQQNEVIRIASTATLKSKSNATLAIAENTLLTTTTAQQKTITYITERGKKPSTKTLTQTADAKTTASLASAEKTGQFDEVFLNTIKAELTTYGEMLSNQYKATKSKSEKELLKTNYDQVVILLNSLK